MWNNSHRLWVSFPQFISIKLGYFPFPKPEHCIYFTADICASMLNTLAGNKRYYWLIEPMTKVCVVWLWPVWLRRPEEINISWDRWMSLCASCCRRLIVCCWDVLFLLLATRVKAEVVIGAIWTPDVRCIHSIMAPLLDALLMLLTVLKFGW